MHNDPDLQNDCSSYIWIQIKVKNRFTGNVKQRTILKKIGVQCLPRRAPRVIEVNWHPPLYGCIKLNTDGVWKSSSNKAGYGGVFCDYSGKMIGVFFI